MRNLIRSAHSLKPGRKIKFEALPKQFIRIKLMAHQHVVKPLRQYQVVNELQATKLIVCDHTVDNVIAACLRRTLFHKNERTGELERLPEPKPMIFAEKHFELFKIKVSEEVTKLVYDHDLVIPWSEEEYVDNTPTHKRGLYKRAKCSKDLRMDLSEQDKTLRATIKAEKKEFKNDFIPRLFFPRSPAYNIELGRFLKPIEELTYQGINVAFSGLKQCSILPSVTKGFNSLARGELINLKWKRFKNPVAISFDCAHFDKHIRSELLRFEHSYYKSLYIGSDKKVLSDLLRAQINNKMDVFTRDGFRVVWDTDGGRMSGDVNTALGNVFCVCSVVYNYAQNSVAGEFELVDEGDDFFIVCEERNSKQWDELPGAFAQAGLTLRIEGKTNVIQKIVFCQASPMSINGEWRMVRSFKSVFDKDLACLVARTLDEFKVWLHEVGTGGAILNSGVPVFSNFYNKLKKWGSVGELTRSMSNDMHYSSLRYLTSGMEEETISVTPEARFQFYLMTDVHPDDQVCMEEIIDGLSNEIFHSGPDENFSQVLPVINLINQFK